MARLEGRLTVDGSLPFANGPEPIEFDVHTPLTKLIIAGHIAHALSLGLPEADGDELSTLNIIANGPSARGQTFVGPCMALNGAINLFPEDDPPFMWACCDPQELVADFLKNPSPKTTYIVASKCHPAVFERLAGLDVRLWHINDHDIPGVRRVPCAVSITLCAMMLAQRLGWRRLNIYGWDACFSDDGAHHGSGEGHAPMPETVDIEVGERHFTTCATWGAEAHDAMNIIPVMEWCGVEVHVHGDGMIAAIRRELKARPHMFGDQPTSLQPTP